MQLMGAEMKDISVEFMMHCNAVWSKTIIVLKNMKNDKYFT